MNIIKGQFHLASNSQFAIVSARFNSFVVDSLTQGALDTLARHGVSAENIQHIEVPGAFELPLVCKKLAETQKYAAVIALGCVIRGATTHYDYVCNEAAKGIASASVQTGVPIIFGVLTTENIEQAIERAGTKAGNKGAEAALSAIEMANLFEQLR